MHQNMSTCIFWWNIIWQSVMQVRMASIKLKWGLKQHLPFKRCPASTLDRSLTNVVQTLVLCASKSDYKLLLLRLQEYGRAGDQTGRDATARHSQVCGSSAGHHPGAGRHVQAHAADRGHGRQSGHHLSLQEQTEQEEENPSVHRRGSGHGSQRNGVSCKQAMLFLILHILHTVKSVQWKNTFLPMLMC